MQTTAQPSLPFKLRYIKTTNNYQQGDFHRCPPGNHETIFTFNKEGSLYCTICHLEHSFFLTPLLNGTAEKFSWMRM